MTPILIAGGGPVGLALATILAHHAIPSIVIEERLEPTPRDESRAITWMPPGLDLLDWLGIGAAFDQRGVRRSAHEFWDTQRCLLRLRFDTLPVAHPYSLQLPQHDTEQLLEQAALATGLVEIRRGQRIVGLDAAAATATAQIAAATGTYTLTAPWGVGCDGARSQVRQFLAIPERRVDYGTYSAVADFAMTCALPLDVSRIVLTPRRPYGFFSFAPERWRLIYRINQGEDRQAMTTAAAATALLMEYLPQASIQRFLWASAFRLNQGQSQTYSRGPWLLAGDAAHAMGPSAGAGMMLGLLGAWRLGDCLARAIHGQMTGEEVRLEYEHVQRHWSHAVQSSNALVFRNMAISNPLLATGRAAALRLLGGIPAFTHRMMRSEAMADQPLPLVNEQDMPITR